MKPFGKLTPIGKVRRQRDNLQLQLDAVDKALPDWEYTGRGRVQTIADLRTDLQQAEEQSHGLYLAFQSTQAERDAATKRGVLTYEYALYLLSLNKLEAAARWMVGDRCVSERKRAEATESKLDFVQATATSYERQFKAAEQEVAKQRADIRRATEMLDSVVAPLSGDWNRRDAAVAELVTGLRKRYPAEALKQEGAAMDETLVSTTVPIRLGLWQSLRVLFGAGITVRIAHEGPAYKAIVFVGGDEMGKVVPDA